MSITKWYWRWLIGIPVWLLAILLAGNGLALAGIPIKQIAGFGGYVMQIGYGIGAIVMFWMLGLIKFRFPG